MFNEMTRRLLLGGVGLLVGTLLFSTLLLDASVGGALEQRSVEHGQQAANGLGQFIEHPLLIAGCVSFGVGFGLLLLLLIWRSMVARGQHVLDGRWPAWILAITLSAAQLTLLASHFDILSKEVVRVQGAQNAEVSQQISHHLAEVRQGEAPGLPSEELLNEYLEQFDSLERIALVDGNGEMVRRVGRSSNNIDGPGIGPLHQLIASLFVADGDLRITLEGDGGAQSYLSLAFDANPVRQQLMTNVSNGVTAILIALLLCIEISILLLLRLGQANAQASRPAPDTFKLMRPAIFLFLFGIDISMSFIPLHMEGLYGPLWGLSKEMIIGLPISMEFLCVGVAILLSGIWMDHRGWHEPFFCGLALAMLGGVYSWLAPDTVHFILSRGLVGLGYGLTLLAAQGYVIRHTDARSKARGLAHMFAGLYSGSICGAAAGAIMAERFGYEAVFLGGALIVFGVMGYGWLFIGMPGSKRTSTVTPARSPEAQGSRVSAFLLDRRVLAVMLFSSLPASIAVVGFLNYFSPLYLSRQGVSESTIGQILMLFGISLTLLGPAIGRLVDRSESKKVPILLGAFLGSAAFLSFSVLEGVAAATLAVVLLGLSNSFVLSSQSAYVLQLDVTKRLGEGKAMGLFRSSSRIGQMAGPMVFAWLILVVDIQNGVTYFGLAYLLTALLFLALTFRESEASITRERAI